jgi:hypothetical protein
LVELCLTGITPITSRNVGATFSSIPVVAMGFGSSAGKSVNNQLLLLHLSAECHSRSSDRPAAMPFIAIWRINPIAARAANANIQRARQSSELVIVIPQF